MNRDETVALFLQGREAWNAWAERMLAERKSLEEAGRWVAEKNAFGDPEPRNGVTRSWLNAALADFSRCLFRGAGWTNAATAQKEADDGEPPAKWVLLDSYFTDFRGFIFPGPVRFDRAEFVGGSALFESAQFVGGATSFALVYFAGGDARFDRACFTGGSVRFDSAQFTGGLTQFDGALFAGGNAWFRGSKFIGGYASFEGAQFTGGNVSFDGAQISGGPARFDGVQFTGGYASFERVQFTGGDTSFEHSHFKGGDAWFSNAHFSGGDARFSAAKFAGGDARFEAARFACNAQFSGTRFTGGSARFQRAAFTGGCAFFDGAQFLGGPVQFESAQFSGGPASFNRTQFNGGPACFDRAMFTGGPAVFRGQTFIQDVFFNDAIFGPRGKADFSLVTFEQDAQFDRADFRGEADFNAVWGKRTFSVAGARFESVPNFIQAHFEEAPRLDNLVVEERISHPHEDKPEKIRQRSRRMQLHRVCQIRSHAYRRLTGGISVQSPLRDASARWRALKRLAIEGHDIERELQFFSGEMRSARFAGHWPLPWPLWKLKVWGGVLGFWAGLLYQIFSDFGRSMMRPFLAWALCIVIFAVYFLGQNSEMTLRRDHHYGSWLARAGEYARTAWQAYLAPPYCYPGTKPNPSLPEEDRLEKKQNGFTGLVEEVRDDTNLVNEALSIAYHNAVLILDSSGDSAHRAFGCLYGVERYGGNPVAYVPRGVAIASGIQKLFSAIFIFLFGLAVRNMLKMK